jgi:CDP-glycerol glycerophosphotransferase (TagB/SpsB family)
VDQLSAATAHASVVEVTDHPDISDLYLAADVLVTDYSSAMFDFALTGRPMLRATPIAQRGFADAHGMLEDGFATGRALDHVLARVRASATPG